MKSCKHLAASVILPATLACCMSVTLRGESVVKIAPGDGKVIITVDGELFAEYRYDGLVKPIVYPIIGPHGVQMTRHYPMREGVDNEASDHPHHESLWFTHDEINGVNFWSAHTSKASEGRTARVVQTKIELGANSIQAENEWRNADDQVVFTDTRRLTFGATPKSRHIDYQITIHASHGDVTFGDTKEGTMAIRTHPMLRLDSDPRRGNHTAAGHAVNSEGDTDRDLWGKRAKWVDYWAPVNGHTVGIAIMDHPSNPRHPTWWHARQYGLVAANPFGIHDFENKPKGTGDMTIKDGSSVTFQYRYVFHEGDANSANIEQLYADFASAKE